MLYSPDDESAMIARVPEMMRAAEEMRSTHVAPTKLQRAAIADIIWNFVRRRARKIYGGHALNAAILEIEPGSAIYAPDECHDIEFYSPDPISDVVELCNHIFIDGHRFVQGREAAHHGTFTISVEFTRVCDVTYAPKKVYDSIPQRLYAASPGIDPLPMIDPAFAIIDHLKILADPFTSYWKLDRMMPRIMLTQRLFPLTLPQLMCSPPPLQPNSSPPPITANAIAGRRHHKYDFSAILDHVEKKTTLIIVGDHAAAYFDAANGVSTPFGKHMTLVSVDYDADVTEFASLLGVSPPKPPTGGGTPPGPLQRNLGGGSM